MNIIHIIYKKVDPDRFALEGNLAKPDLLTNDSYGYSRLVLVAHHFVHVWHIFCKHLYT